MKDIDKKYAAATEWLFSQLPLFQNVGAAAYKPGLDTVRALCNAFGNPQNRFESIHVAGTNGKGSTSSLLASILQEQGYKTGLFTSPHLLDFRERIRVNGRMITKEGVVDFLDSYRAMNLDLRPSFFELTTVMAFDWFAREGCEMAVIEVGLGGRLDSTNIITPRLSIITNISLDHTNLLGDTPGAIAAEKAGIIKPGIPVVIGQADGEVRRVFEEKAAKAKSEIVFAQEDENLSLREICDEGNRYEDSRYGALFSPLSGDCQEQNARTVLASLPFVGDFAVDAVRNGFLNVEKNTGLRGRWTVLPTAPRIIYDTGHNPGGWAFNGPRLKEIAQNGPLTMIIGFVADKDIDAILAMMPRNARYYFCQPEGKRANAAEDTQSRARACGLNGQTAPSVDEALKSAIQNAEPDETIFIGGSNFIVAQALETLKSIHLL